ncbi:MAG: indolepyruvate ferredoxin oxidoreductase family protein [Acidimicrobiales bacterium]|nr:indolepyruvate ferredoxin oxidoreductase family protein [Acidimicrobiales bacterium]
MTDQRDRSDYQLTDRFLADRGTVHLSGIQALARLPIDQLRADRRAGLITAAFASGYPGSPLGGYDSAIAQAAKLATDLPIIAQPATNEESAATSVMGTQLAMTQPDARYDGVVGIWYGKAPGVDRAADALRHAVFAGTYHRGGAVALVGDDPMAKSSTLPSSSAGLLADLHIPVLYPGDPAEALDLGRHAVAMSRSTGLWTALKIVADVADGTSSIHLDPDRIQPIIPRIDGERYQRMPDVGLLPPRNLEIEREIYEVRYPLAVRYVAENQLNHAAVDPTDAWLAIVTSGITFFEVREALIKLGFESNRDIEAAGIRLIRLRCPLPFDAARMRELTNGVEEVVVVEEKNPHVESLVKDALYPLPERPIVVGKQDEQGQPLIPGWSALTAGAIAEALRGRLTERLGSRIKPPPPPQRELIPLKVERAPFFCSGCPHNRSTEVPPGSLVGAGIGCHTMVLFMDEERVGTIAGLTAMGNEGSQWIGMAPFIERDHLIQNLGDGTYFHSGQLAITAAVASGVNITYKLLWNGAVAMTGGQLPQGQLPLEKVAGSLLAKGVSRVLITSDDVQRTKALDLPPGIDVWDRSRGIEAQQLLAATPGVTVLIHDQACAAEARRARKRGLIPTPTQRVVINERVCEGCGDCGRVSNCLSVQPVQTPFGRKTAIDQTTCNLDYSCLEGDCPSFMTIELDPDAPPSAAFDPIPEINSWVLPDPDLVVSSTDVSIRIVGVGGTGVVTVSQVLGTAAMLAGHEARGLDQIGLSQKAGPVVSDLRLLRDEIAHSSRLGADQADVLLVFDQLVAASPRGLLTADPERTVVVGSSTVTPTGQMVADPTIVAPTSAELAARIAEHTRTDHTWWADAAEITTDVFGDAVAANVFVVGMAVQAGALPLEPAVVEQALGLNGVAVDKNVAAFRLGRHQICDPGTVTELRHRCRPDRPRPFEATDPALIAAVDAIEATTGDADLRRTCLRLSHDLVGFADHELARAYVATVARVAAAEAALPLDSTALTKAVAVNLHRFMAYKDEYEVARLLLDDDALAEARRLAGPTGKISYRLHPPMLRALGMDRKIKLGTWSQPALRALARGKKLRGTRLDPFGLAKVRRIERKLPDEYRATLETLLAHLGADNHQLAVEIAGLPDGVRGYEHLKLQRVAEYREATKAALRRYQRPG